MQAKCLHVGRDVHDPARADLVRRNTSLKPKSVLTKNPSGKVIKANFAVSPTLIFIERSILAFLAAEFARDALIGKQEPAMSLSRIDLSLMTKTDTELLRLLA